MQCEGEKGGERRQKVFWCFCTVRKEQAQVAARCEGEKLFTDPFWRVWVPHGHSFPTNSSLFWPQTGNTPTNRPY